MGRAHMFPVQLVGIAAVTVVPVRFVVEQYAPSLRTTREEVKMPKLPSNPPPLFISLTFLHTLPDMPNKQHPG